MISGLTPTQLGLLSPCFTQAYAASQIPVSAMFLIALARILLWWCDYSVEYFAFMMGFKPPHHLFATTPLHLQCFWPAAH